MDIKPPAETGFSLLLTWGVIEWALTGMLTAGAAVAGWVWHLGLRIKELENSNKFLTDELEQQNKRLAEAVSANKSEILQMQQLVRSLGNALDRKLNEETTRLESRMERLTEKLEQVREELPSRQFIEGQINNLGARIDRSIDARAARD